MTAFISLSTLAVALTLIVSGCSDRREGDGVSEVLDNRVALFGSVPDPCDLVLAPLASPGDKGHGSSSDVGIARFQQAVLASNRPVDHFERLGWALVQEGRASSDPGFLNLALQGALCMEKKRPNSLAAMLLRGHVLHNLHRFREAETLGRKLVALRGAWFDYGLLGDALTDQGKLDEAVSAYQSMMDQRPGPQSYSRAAQVRWLKGDLVGAIEMMELARGAAAGGDRESAAWMNVRLALYLLQAGNIVGAEKRAAEALALQAGYAPALLAQGRILLAKGEVERAGGVLAEAEQISPQPEYQWTLAEALRAAGREGDADTVEAELARRGEREDRRTYALFLASTGGDPNPVMRRSA
ncbi:MAG: hypothetical protein U9Q81_26275 [Pseudomonadota bacterium]|nr:hypothetical protein [Pseudomonadota bacterium]